MTSNMVFTSHLYQYTQTIHPSAPNPVRCQNVYPSLSYCTVKWVFILQRIITAPLCFHRKQKKNRYIIESFLVILKGRNAFLQTHEVKDVVNLYYFSSHSQLYIFLW